jgi:hypothetical protein
METQKEFTKETKVRLFTLAANEYLSEYNPQMLEKLVFDPDYDVDNFFEDEDTIVYYPYECREGDAQEGIFTLYALLCREVRWLTDPTYKLYED